MRTLAVTVVAPAVAALSLCFAGAPAADAATAGLSSPRWHQVSLPAPMDEGVQSVVSCVHGTSFCLAVGSFNGLYTAIVTTDAGAHWREYSALSALVDDVAAVSCPTTAVCWLTGWTQDGIPAAFESTDGGQTWTDKSPGDWPSGPFVAWQPWSIDCVSAATCWIAGDNFTSQGFTPLVLETTDAGADWTSFSNVPWPAQYDPNNGPYQLKAISCTSALDCVAGGGLDGPDGVAQVVSTTDGGATWALTADPTLAGLQEVFGLSCLAGANGLPACYAAAVAPAGGAVMVRSADGGTTWSGMKTLDDTGYMSSVSCPDVSHCWATGGGTTVGLAGTRDGGSTWSVVTSDTPNEDGSVSCASVRFCVTTTDNALWQTRDGGGLVAAA